MHFLSIETVKNDNMTLYRLMPCPFTGLKMFCAGPNILSQPKNLAAFMPCPFTGRKMF